MKCDAAEFAGMYELIYQDLYRFALCVMRNPHDAEDAVSEAVIRGYEHLSSLRSRESFKNWMFTILSNVCKKKLRMQAKQKTVSETTIFTGEMEGGREDLLELGLDVRRAFSILTEEEQLIVGLSVFGGYQSKEIGKMLKLKDSTVRSKRSRALEKMSVILCGGRENGQASYNC